MKILNRLTIKHLLQNKKRTIVTIIGIVLSTSLMVGIGLLLSSFLNSTREIAIKNNGAHHVEISSITQKEKEQLEQNIEFQETYSYGTVGFAKIESQNEYKPYLFLASADDYFFHSENLLEGRFPLNNNEIVIPDSLLQLDNGGASYQIGDKITLQIGSRKINEDKIFSNEIALFVDEQDEVSETLVPIFSKTYTIVGIMKRSIKEGYQSPGYMAYTTKEEHIESYHLYGIYKNVHKTYEITKDICSQLSDEANCKTNDEILYFYGASRYENIILALTWTFAIILFLLSIGCIIVIYNSFAISTMERKKSFGLYISLGATPKQIKYTVFYEAFLVGIIGIVLGILGAFFGIYVVIQILDYLIGPTYGMHLVFYIEPLFIYIPIIFMIFVVFFSAFVPALRSSKVTAISLIRENEDIKIPKKKIRTPKFIEKLFGIEGEIALKNIKRNKRKYRITIISLFISIVLFLSFSTYLKIGLNIVDSSEIPDYDAYAMTSDQNLVKELKNLDSLKEAYIVRNNILSITIPEENIEKEYLEFIPNNKVTFYVTLLEDETYKELKEDLQLSDSNYLIYNDGVYTTYLNGNRQTYFTPFLNNLKELTICEEENCKTLPVTLFRKLTPFLEKIILSKEMPTIFIPESDASFLDEENFSYYVTLIGQNGYEDLMKELDSQYKNNKNISYFSPKQSYKEDRNTALAIQILLYGFITLVSLIGVTSVFNTIHTSIHLRRKEFAMLRSVGLSPRGFNRMIFFESFFFGIKSLLYALPVSFGFMILINAALNNSFYFNQLVIPWESILLCIFLVFFLVLLMMSYSVHKIKKENILNSLKDENI